MIYLTGDVHSSRMGEWEQDKIGSEIKAAERYLEILEEYQLKSTLFINGICLDENWEEVKPLLNNLVELGGHTYNNFNGMNIFKSYISRKIFGCIYGSKKTQRGDIEKTKRAFVKRDLEMKSWRTHAFGSNNETFNLLKSVGVKFVSDFVGEIKPIKDNELIHLPINIPVDQNTISYGKLTNNNRDPFASCVKGRISPDEWFEIIKKRITYNEKEKINSILLIHPATMATLDNFELFRKIAEFSSLS
jgi:peptidoglycan/xylan/chitin deacetylase (PgdA/CDA1 family)